jgi:hypothetical protein
MPTTGDPVHVSFQISKTRQELINKRKAFKLRTDLEKRVRKRNNEQIDKLAQR